LELNVTFYRQVRSSTFQKWYEAVPEGFRFSVKMSRFITHIRRLDVDVDTLDKFFEGVRVLADKLGVVLIQLPPSLKFDPALLRQFFSRLDPDIRYTLEARNKTFLNEEAFDILRQSNIAWCVSETAGRYPYAEALTADFVYLRLHGREQLYSSNYRGDELAGLADKIRSWGRDAYVYFNNDFEGFAPKNAATLRDLLAVPPESQE
jgi:uncharacterized protein YecE (DUF72 family)